MKVCTSVFVPVAEYEALRKDAERWRYINTRNNIWRRENGERPCSLLCVVLLYGADLSCRATREAAIDAAMQEARPFTHAEIVRMNEAARTTMKETP